MARQLVKFVWLQDPENGSPVGFAPGDHVPAWAEEQITNPSCWSDGQGETPNAADPSTSADPAPDSGGSSEPPSGDGPPPTVGAGSGRDAWAAYADAKGFQVEPGDKKKDIIAGLEAAGVPVRKG